MDDLIVQELGKEESDRPTGRSEMVTSQNKEESKPAGPHWKKAMSGEGGGGNGGKPNRN